MTPKEFEDFMKRIDKTAVTGDEPDEESWYADEAPWWLPVGFAVMFALIVGGITMLALHK